MPRISLTSSVGSVAPPSSASNHRGFEIYVNPTVDPDIGEIVIVKKKSRVALDSMSWGTLGEATNVPKSSTQIEPVSKECSC